MASGVVYDIREFTTHDGPGLRITVFLKGCPLRCVWCHNPEGISAARQTMRTAAGERTVGRVYDDESLASLLNRQAGILRANSGGVTFSGGEPLAQPLFLESVLDRLDGLHVVLDTSGFAPEDVFVRIARRCHLVYFDVKLAGAADHRRYTGEDNDSILSNLRLLPDLDIPFVIRVPLIPGITDTDENLGAIAALARGLRGLERIDLLPYNRAAGGKYAPLGWVFHPPFDQDQPVNANLGLFADTGVPVSIPGRRLV